MLRTDTDRASSETKSGVKGQDQYQIRLCYLAKLPIINFCPNNTDTFWMHTPYRIWESSAKLKSYKWVSENEIGQNQVYEIDHVG